MRDCQETDCVVCSGCENCSCYCDCRVSRRVHDLDDLGPGPDSVSYNETSPSTLGSTILPQGDPEVQFDDQTQPCEAEGLSWSSVLEGCQQGRTE